MAAESVSYMCVCAFAYGIETMDESFGLYYVNMSWFNHYLSTHK